MIDKNSFRNITPCSGSQQGGFEELISQLAHLEPPATAKNFIRKEGAGGDAGVECYWTLENGDEHGWQAKYFLDTMAGNRWSQVDKSVKAALKKHPKLVKFYVCIPLDRTDVRRTGPGGKQTISMQDEWSSKVLEWQEIAKQQSIEVEFEYWGASELLMRLQTDNPKYSGRALYWLDSPVLTSDKFKKCLEKQERILGERYTEEFHVDLPIAEIFESLGNTDEFWCEFNKKVKKFNEAVLLFRKLAVIEQLDESFANVVASLDDLWRTLRTVVVTRDRGASPDVTRKLNVVTASFRALFDSAYEFSEATKRPVRNERSLYENLVVFSRELREFDSFANGTSVRVNSKSAALIAGIAGSGKSHLLCDVAKRFVGAGRPAVLLLGQHYQGGDPIDLLVQHLDLKSQSNEQVLGALDAAGEAAGTCALLLIDAVNEGGHRLQWYERLAGLLADVDKFPNLAIAVSCRTSYEDKLIPDNLDEKEIVRVVHEGFRGREHKAAEVYLSKQGIAKPTAPITTPEFSNPLFVKTCAAALKQAGETSWPKGHQGATKLFEIYLNSLEAVLARKRNVSIHSKACEKSLKAIARAMFPDKLFGVPWDEASTIISAFDESKIADDTLLDAILREGALADDISSHYQPVSDDNSSVSDEIVVRFSYERFCDHFVAEMLVEGVDDPSALFAESGQLANLDSHDVLFKLRGILDALSVIVPEKFGVELYDLLPASVRQFSDTACFAFANGLSRRTPASFSDRTLELLNSLTNRLHESTYQFLLQVSTEPAHPWNAERLHKHLVVQPLSKRDASWSTFVAQSDFEEDEYSPDSIVRSIIEWATFGKLDGVEEERVFLTLIVLTWLTTTTKRRTRDHASKAMARLFSKFPQLAVPLLEKFKVVDDLYVHERLYGAVYGGFCNNNANQILGDTAIWIHENLFTGGRPTPHLQLRDYARGVVELCEHRNCLPNEVVIARCRPPYSSDWPIENPAADEFNSYEASKIENSVFSDDFGHYTINHVTDWSPTELKQSKAETQEEVLARLKAKLTPKAKKLFEMAVELQRTKEENRFRKHKSSFQVGNVVYVDSNSDRESIEIEETIVDSELLDHLAAMDASVPKFPEDDESTDVPSEEDVENAWELFNDELDIELKEEFRWANSFWRERNDLQATFSRRWAKRWVCKKALEMWKAEGVEEQLEQFESQLRYADRRRPAIERYGKKYQNIALAKLLARQSDNLHFIGNNYSEDPSVYDGPWQVSERDIDPTIWLRKTHDDGWGEWGEDVWYRPVSYRFGVCGDEDKKAWCESSSDVPKFENWLASQSPIDGSSWLTLKGYSKWREEKVAGDPSELIRDIWFKITSVIVKERDFEQLKTELSTQDYLSSLVKGGSTYMQTFLRECSWHESFDVQDVFSEGASGEIKTPHILTFTEYEWEKDDDDESLDTSLRIYLPSKSLQNGLEIEPDLDRFNVWVDSTHQPSFIDPSIEFDGPSFALVKTELMKKFLTENQLVLVWLIGGEKMVVDSSHMPVRARMIINSILWTDGLTDIESLDRHHLQRHH